MRQIVEMLSRRPALVESTGSQLVDAVIASTVQFILEECPSKPVLKRLLTTGFRSIRKTRTGNWTYSVSHEVFAPGEEGVIIKAESADPKQPQALALYTTPDLSHIVGVAISIGKDIQFPPTRIEPVPFDEVQLAVRTHDEEINIPQPGRVQQFFRPLRAAASRLMHPFAHHQ